MTFGWGNGGFGCNVACESQCPPSHIYIQPPCYAVTIPGPVMHCDTEPCAASSRTPCGYGGCGYGGYGGYGGWGYGGRGWGYGGYGGWGY